MRKFCLLLGLLVLTAGATHPPVSSVRPKPSDSIDFPTLIWGGDVATLAANGGQQTTPSSFWGKAGVKVRLVPGDDFDQQVKRYLIGETPFLRGELGMLGARSELLNASPATKPVILYLMTYSAGGDCLVAVDPIRNVNDLKAVDGKKKRVALQKNGPHMNLFNIILTNAHMTWDDVEVVWCKDLTGDPAKGDHPGARLRRGEADACFVISPDMIGLTTGPGKVGNGKEGTVKGARDILDTKTLSRGVMDVFAVRKDFYDENTDYCKKITAGFMRGTYDLMSGQVDYDAKKKTPAAKAYIDNLTLARKYFGDVVIPNVEIEGVGMVHDAEFQGIPGNIAFFHDKGNLNNFERMQTEVLNLANTLKFATKRSGFLPSPWDWKEIASVAGVKYDEPNLSKPRIAENIDLLPGDESKYSFTVNFGVDQDTFNADTYGNVLDDCIKLAASYRNGVVLVRGHTDISKTLFDLVVVLRENGVLKESGNGTNKQYFLNGEPLNLGNTAAITKLISESTFEGFPRQVNIRGKQVQVDNPKDDVSAMDTLSRRRAEAFRAAVIQRAKDTKVNLDASQIQITGVGIREPLVSRPRNPQQAMQNMRVEIQVREVGGEALSPELFNP